MRLLLVIMLFATLVAQAETYRCVNKNGVEFITDSPDQIGGADCFGLDTDEPLGASSAHRNEVRVPWHWQLIDNVPALANRPEPPPVLELRGFATVPNNLSELQRLGIAPEAAQPAIPSQQPRALKRTYSDFDKALLSGEATIQERVCALKTRCDQMNGCRDARYYLKTCANTDLDPDRDGIPCESLCSAESDARPSASTTAETALCEHYRQMADKYRKLVMKIAPGELSRSQYLEQYQRYEMLLTERC